MNIWNKVFLVLIFIFAGIALIFWGGYYHTQKKWRDSIVAHDNAIARTEENIVRIQNGSLTGKDKNPAEKSFEEMSLSEAKKRLNLFVIERKKAWFGCEAVSMTKPDDVDAQGQEIHPGQLTNLPDRNSMRTPDDQLIPVKLVRVQIQVPEDKYGRKDDLRLIKGTIVFLFSEGIIAQEEGGPKSEGAFLGRFVVTDIQIQSGLVTLLARDELNENEIRLLEESRSSTWSLHTAMPQDRHKGSVARFPDPQESAEAPTEMDLSNAATERTLQDFDVLIDYQYRQRVELQRDIALNNRAIASLWESLAIAKQEEDLLRTDGRKEQKRLDLMKEQRDVISKAVNDHDTMIKMLQERIEDTQTQNEKNFSRIAEMQWKAADKINNAAKVASQKME